MGVRVVSFDLEVIERLGFLFSSLYEGSGDGVIDFISVDRICVLLDWNVIPYLFRNGYLYTPWGRFKEVNGRVFYWSYGYEDWVFRYDWLFDLSRRSVIKFSGGYVLRYVYVESRVLTVDEILNKELVRSLFNDLRVRYLEYEASDWGVGGVLA